MEIAAREGVVGAGAGAEADTGAGAEVGVVVAVARCPLSGTRSGHIAGS